MLVDHADPKIHSRFRALQLNLFTFKKQFPFVGSINTGKHIHQCTFARTVLAKQSMHFTGIQREVYLIVCYNAREPFGDVFHLQNRLYHVCPPVDSAFAIYST